MELFFSGRKILLLEVYTMRRDVSIREGLFARAAFTSRQKGGILNLLIHHPSGGAHGYPPAALFSGFVRRNELHPRVTAAVSVAAGPAAEHHGAGSRALRPAVRQRPPQTLAHRAGAEFAAPCGPGGGTVPADAGGPPCGDPVGPAGAHRHQCLAGAGLPARAGDPAGQVPPAVPPH